MKMPNLFIANSLQSQVSVYEAPKLSSLPGIPAGYPASILERFFSPGRVWVGSLEHIFHPGDADLGLESCPGFDLLNRFW